MHLRAVALSLLVAAASPLLAQSVGTTPRTPSSERPTVGAREIERAVDEMAIRRERNAPPRLRSARLREAIRDFQANDAKVVPMHLTFGEFVTASGQYFVAMHFDAALPADVSNATLFGSIVDGSGKEQWSIEDTVALQRAPDGTAYSERSLALPPAYYQATFGFAVKGEPVAMTSEPLSLRELTRTSRGVSRLLVSSQLFPLDKAQAADAPFAFGGIKVVPKGDRTFHRGDELWIFFEAQNPGVDDAGAPQLVTSVALEGNGATRRGLAADVQPLALKGVPGHFGLGTTIDVSRLKPGEYVLHVSVSDAIAKQTYELQEKIAIVD